MSCGGSRWSARFRQHRLHESEAVGVHGHTANGGDIDLRAELSAEPALDCVGRRPARRQLTSRQLHAAVTEIDIRPCDQVNPPRPSLGRNCCIARYASGKAGNQRRCGVPFQIAVARFSSVESSLHSMASGSPAPQKAWAGCERIKYECAQRAPFIDRAAAPARVRRRERRMRN